VPLFVPSGWTLILLPGSVTIPSIIPNTVSLVPVFLYDFFFRVVIRVDAYSPFTNQGDELSVQRRTKVAIRVIAGTNQPRTQVVEPPLHRHPVN
jgi:hypothetical protein